MSKASNLIKPVSGIQPSNNSDHKIVFLKVDDLKLYSGNARTHSRKQIKQIANSITQFGFTNPVLLDENGLILAGHGRVEAAKSLGLNQVPCLQLPLMSEAEKRAYILADNKLAMNAGWDEGILALEFEYLIEHTNEIDLSLTGFEISEVDQILEIGGTDQSTEAQEDDQLPELPADETSVTRQGDLWQLGDHRLICGDARDQQVFQNFPWPAVRWGRASLLHS